MSISVKDLRQEWLEAFNMMADAGDDELLFPDIEKEFDEEEWTW